MDPVLNHVVMIASENDALTGAKVGGVADVVRDLPIALSHLGWRTTVIIPSYGFLQSKNAVTTKGTVSFPFADRREEARILQVTPKHPDPNIEHLLIDHPLIGGNPIYFDDPHGKAFSRDAEKYALFCSAAGQYLASVGDHYVLHLHDWHTGILLLLKNLHPAFIHLRDIQTAFTIHNLVIQGTRPFRGMESSVERWFPELFRTTAWIEGWRDLQYKEDSFTPIAAGIRYSDKVNTVSPGYAEEIMHPSDRKNGIFRGEGLEHIVREAKSENRLFGILNGCPYPPDRMNHTKPFPELIDAFKNEVQRWLGGKDGSHFKQLLARLEGRKTNPPAVILTSVTRIVDQKVKLLFERGTSGNTALEEILNLLREVNGIYVLCGAGAADYETHLWKAFARHEELLFLRGYSETIAPLAFTNGTLFLMPSSFEPCGIGQMLAMRDGQPCIVHAVGGLKDTVIDGVNGFSFSGSNIREQVDNLVATVNRAVSTYLNDRTEWERIKQGARDARFTWDESAQRYIELLYF